MFAQLRVAILLQAHKYEIANAYSTQRDYAPVLRYAISSLLLLAISRYYTRIFGNIYSDELISAELNIPVILILIKYNSRW